MCGSRQATRCQYAFTLLFYSAHQVWKLLDSLATRDIEDLAMLADERKKRAVVQKMNERIHVNWLGLFRIGYNQLMSEMVAVYKRILTFTSSSIGVETP